MPRLKLIRLWRGAFRGRPRPRRWRGLRGGRWWVVWRDGHYACGSRRWLGWPTGVTRRGRRAASEASSGSLDSGSFIQWLDRDRLGGRA